MYLMKKAFAITSGILAAFTLPLVSFAAVSNISDVGSFIINTINNVFVPVIFAIAFIVFVYGIFETFILGRGSEEAADKGKLLMLYGLIGFVAMVSVWGLVNILTGSVTFGNNAGVSGGTPTAGVQVGQ
jgi:hypothetical protein